QIVEYRLFRGKWQRYLEFAGCACVIDDGVSRVEFHTVRRVPKQALLTIVEKKGNAYVAAIDVNARRLGLLDRSHDLLAIFQGFHLLAVRLGGAYRGRQLHLGGAPYGLDLRAQT